MRTTRINKTPSFRLRVSMVGTAGIEPATPAMSMQCSPAELRALEAQVYSEMGVFGKPRARCRAKLFAGAQNECLKRQIMVRPTLFMHYLDN